MRVPLRWATRERMDVGDVGGTLRALAWADRLGPFRIPESLMRIALAALGGAALAFLAALPASAKTDPKAGPKKEPSHPRWAHSYAAALEEAKERGCVTFVTLHQEH